ncbi:MAG TPA: TRAP transporter small permease [Ramlibacter sp.]|nr:TRAP transporter small permease [Ramlibacter sp.]
MKIYLALLAACASLAGIIIGAMVVLVTYDVLARNVHLPNLAWVADVTEYALPLATLLVAPWLVHRNEHVRLDLLVVHLPEPVRIKVEKAVYALCCLIAAVIACYSVTVIVDSWRTGSLVIKSFNFAEWLVYLPLPPCFLLIAVECLRKSVGSATEAMAPHSELAEVHA